MNKKIKKIIVNSLTISRIIGTLFIPLMFNSLSKIMFILIIILLFITDAIDGPLARHWEVSTIAGTILDMSADKIFGFAILIIISNIYPIMLIPALLEIVIAVTNLISTNKGNISKSSQIGRIKTIVMWACISILFLTGMTEELIDILNINNNKYIIEFIAISTAIISEFVVAADYIIKAIKNNNKGNKKLFNIIKDKEKLKFIKNIIFDEKYYILTKDKNFIDKFNFSKK